MARSALVGLALLCVTACVPFQPLPDAQPATVQQQIQVGDTVELVRSDDSHLRLKVEAVTDTTLVGTTRDKRYEVPLADVRSISTRHRVQDPVWNDIFTAALIGIVAIVAGGR